MCNANRNGSRNTSVRRNLESEKKMKLDLAMSKKEESMRRSEDSYRFPNIQRL